MSDERSRLASQSRYAFAPEWAEGDEDMDEQDPLAELARIIGDNSILADRHADEAVYDPGYDEEHSELSEDFDSAVQGGAHAAGAGFIGRFGQENAGDDHGAIEAEANDGYYEQHGYDPEAEEAWDDPHDASGAYHQSGEYPFDNAEEEAASVFSEGYDWPEEGQPQTSGALTAGATPFPELDDETFDLGHDGERMSVAERLGMAGRFGILRPVAFAGAALLLVFVIGSGLLSMLRGDPVPLPDGAPPVVQADGRPYKIAPDRRTADADEPLGQAVYDRVAGTEAPGVEQIAPRTEKPVLTPGGSAPRVISTRRDALTQDDLVKTGRTVAIEALDSPATREKQALIGTSTGDDAGADEGPVVAGRRVRTVIVQSGGTRQVEVDSAGRPVPTTNNGAAATALQVAAAPARPTVRPKARPSPVSLVPTPGQAFRPAETQVARSGGGSGPVNLMMVGAAPSASVQQPTPIAVQTAGASTAGGHVVQLTARRSESQAHEAYVGLKRRFPSILGPYQPDVVRADLGDRGVYYRVRIGPMAQRTDAISLCERLKSAGGDCLVLQN